MSDDRSFRAQSRASWTPAAGNRPTVPDLSLGCLQRIADATEAMSRPFVSLLDQVERERGWRRDAARAIEQRDRTIAALRGQVTKLRKRLEAAEGGKG